jgi:hypothetical protein
MEEFLASDIERINNVKRNRLQTWLERGWIVPSIEKASGHGSRNRFSKLDLYGIALFKHLIETARFAREEAAEFLKAWAYTNKGKPANWSAMYNILIFLRGPNTSFCKFFSMYGAGSDFSHLEQIRYEAMKETEGINWDSIFIINFGKIKSDVDKKTG